MRYFKNKNAPISYVVRFREEVDPSESRRVVKADYIYVWQPGKSYTTHLLPSRYDESTEEEWNKYANGYKAYENCVL